MGSALSGRSGRTTVTDASEDDRDLLLAETQRYARLMEVFISVLTHDLRNPLTAIITASQLLKSDQDVSRAAGHILQSADRMGRLIEQLLDFSRIKLGAGLPLDVCEMDLAAVGRMVVAELEVAYPDRRIQLEAYGELGGIWDRDRLAQLISNLGGNACQHGADPIRIRLDGTDPDVVRIAVDNRGAIPDELLPDLFEPGARNTTSGGLGLGLFIAQQIALAHGGSIHVATTEELTRLLVEMPRRVPDDDDTGTFKLEV